jgi:uncharacterized protein (DUF983 family)
LKLGALLVMQLDGEKRDFWVGFRRGLAGKCPSCGDAKLFSSYLKVVPACAGCGHALGQYKSDDGPAYFTILIVGHVLLAPILLLEAARTLPLALVTAVLLVGLVVVTLWLLPIVKGAFVGAQWALRDDGGP